MHKRHVYIKVPILLEVLSNNINAKGAVIVLTRDLFIRKCDYIMQKKLLIYIGKRVKYALMQDTCIYDNLQIRQDNYVDIQIISEHAR